MCGEVMDQFADHALVCGCGGDRTIKHNAIRDLVFNAARAAMQNPDKEKLGLLPERPRIDRLPFGQHRPADVWLPRGGSGRSEAWDLVATSGLRSDRLYSASWRPEDIFSEYEHVKRN